MRAAWTKAQTLYDQARRGYERSSIHGPTHYSTLAAYSNLAVMFDDLAKMGQLRGEHELIEIQKLQEIQNHPDLRAPSAHEGDLLGKFEGVAERTEFAERSLTEARRDRVDAREWYERAWEGYEKESCYVVERVETERHLVNLGWEEDRVRGWEEDRVRGLGGVGRVGGVGGVGGGGGEGVRGEGTSFEHQHQLGHGHGSLTHAHRRLIDGCAFVQSCVSSGHHYLSPTRHPGYSRPRNYTGGRGGANGTGSGLGGGGGGGGMHEGRRYSEPLDTRLTTIRKSGGYAEDVRVRYEGIAGTMGVRGTAGGGGGVYTPQSFAKS